jgi:PKD repeat protein
MKIFKASLILSAALILASCGKNPQADFSYTPAQPKAGQTVQFTNLSTEARTYSWNFGDMSIGKDENPAHVYQKAGDYIIDLTASAGLKSDTKTVTIHISQ